MDGFCGLCLHRLGLVVLVSLAIMACAAVTLWALRKPEMPIHSFLYHVFNYRARFATSDPGALKRFDDKAVQASVAVAAVVAVFNIVSYLGCRL